MTMLSWPAWGTTARVAVSDPAALPAAQRLATAVLARSERAADRRNPHAELHRLDGSAGRPVRVSRRLAAMVRAALDAARRSGGLVDPTVGNAVVLAEHLRARHDGSEHEHTRHGRPAPDRNEHSRSEHDRSGRPAVGPWESDWAPICGGHATPTARPALGWQSVDVDGRYVTVPAHALLDLGAIGKAVTVQHCAELIHRRLGVGVLVGLGGDVATAGPAPARGWPPVSGLEPVLAGDGVATVCAEVIDPRTGRPAPQLWPAITVRRNAAAGGVVAAKTLALAAAVVGPAAALWLDDQGVGPADRLLEVAPGTTAGVPAGSGQDGPAEVRRGGPTGTRAASDPNGTAGTAPPAGIGRLPQPGRPDAHLLRPAG